MIPALILIAVAPALAIDAHGFAVGATSSDPGSFTRMGTPLAGKNHEFDVGFFVDYADDPLVELLPDGPAPVIDALATANAYASYSFGGLRFDAQVPVYLVGLDASGTFTTVGDARFGVGVPILKPRADSVPAPWAPALGVYVGIHAPTGDDARYLGAAGPRALAAARLHTSAGPVGLMAMAGAVVAVSEGERNLAARGGPSFGAGVSVAANDWLSAQAEVTAEGDHAFDSLPVEATVAARARLPGGAFASIGGATGLSSGIGASRWRAFVGVGWGLRKPDPVAPAPLAYAPDPEADRDADGFNDAIDRCPDQPETIDGFTDDDGCPELDGDADGVPFERDACPTEPIRPEQDPRTSDGCPRIAELAGDRIIITETVYFREGRADLIPSSDRVLEAVRDVLQNHDEVAFVLIEGHTNSNATEEWNARLSDARAFAVARWLAEAGVDPTRLVSKGYGESRPLVPDTHPDALAINRRVEFKVLRVEDIPEGARRLEVPEDAR